MSCAYRSESARTDTVPNTAISSTFQAASRPGPAAPVVTGRASTIPAEHSCVQVRTRIEQEQHRVRATSMRSD